MAYLALYRKYRPRTFDEVIGQEHITKTLANQVAKGQIGHAYLFTGSRGTGKTSSAKIFAKAINCENNQNGSPCGECGSCVALDDPSNIDVLEIDAASNNRVDEIRDLREKIGYTPVSCKYKVYIIDEVHMLTDSAFNALLKTLEEPPKHAVFILATTEVHKLPATILSRCMRFDFRLIPAEILADHLMKIFEKENIKCDKESAMAIAVAGEGSVRDTLSIADCVVAYCKNVIKLEDVLSILGVNERETLLKFANSVKEKNIGKGLEIIDKVYKNGKNLSVFARDIANHFRDLLVAKTCKEPNSILGLPNDYFEKYLEQATKFNMDDLLADMKIFSSILAELKYSLSPRVLIETALISAIDGENLDMLKKN